MKISVTPFFKTIPLFCQSLSFYGKNLNPPFRENFEKKPSFIKGWEVPTMMSPFTFKTMLYETAVNSFDPLLIFCHKELHLRCCIGLELNIVAWSTKILKAIGGLLSITECNLRKIWKNHPPKCLKSNFPEVFYFKLSFLHLLSNGLNGVYANSLT